LTADGAKNTIVNSIFSGESRDILLETVLQRGEYLLVVESHTMPKMKRGCV
jgi:hypothetical protein